MELWKEIYAVLWIFHLFIVLYLTLMVKKKAAPASRVVEWLYPLVLMIFPILLNFFIDFENAYFHWFFILLIFAGFSLTMWGILTLRKSFSIIVEAVKLVKSGPYKYIKHPVYLGEFITIFGYLLAANELIGYILFGLLLFLMYFRIKMEERKLMEAFPEEKDYFENTSSFFPFRYIIGKIKKNR